MLDMIQFGGGLATGATIIGFAGKWFFATKSELSTSEDGMRKALQEHANIERTQGDAKFEKLFDKVDAMRDGLSDLRVEIANGNRYARRRATDPEQT